MNYTADCGGGGGTGEGRSGAEERRLCQRIFQEDRIMMDDFNAAMSSMESGMTRTAAQAAEASSQGPVDSGSPSDRQ